MQTKNRRDFGVVHATLFDHQLGAAFFTNRRHFFSGLKNKFHRTGEVAAHSRQNFRHAHQNRHMCIVAASVHHTGFGTIPFGACVAFERHIGFFGHRQAIHIRTQGHTGTGFAANQYPDHAGIGDLLTHLVKAQFAQMCRHHFCRCKFTVAQFWIGMEVAPPGDDLAFKPISVITNRGIKRK